MYAGAVETLGILQRLVERLKVIVLRFAEVTVNEKLDAKERFLVYFCHR
jgi:hypothetical protein